MVVGGSVGGREPGQPAEQCSSGMKEQDKCRFGKRRQGFSYVKVVPEGVGGRGALNWRADKALLDVTPLETVEPEQRLEVDVWKFALHDFP